MLVLTTFLQSIVHDLLNLIYICGHFLTVNILCYGRSYVKEFLPLCTFLEFYTHLEPNSARSFQNAFYKCSRALNIMFFFNFKKMYFWWTSSFFSLSGHLRVKNSTFLIQIGWVMYLTWLCNLVPGVLCHCDTLSQCFISEVLVYTSSSFAVIRVTRPLFRSLN